MMKPTIHTNGTSAADLLDAYLTASVQVRKAIEALDAAAPNGRDYYPQGPDAINQAVREHRDRRTRLASVLAELNELVGHADDSL